MHVVMIGATGLVGSRAACGMLTQGWTVEALLRRPSGLARDGRREHVAPPEEWPAIASSLRAGAAVSALGTTIRQAGYSAIDADVVASAVSGALRQTEPGVYRHENRSIRALA